jgi:hypothetical protein
MCNLKGLKKENILKWLGSINTIYRFQESYSRMIEKIAAETKTRLVDIRTLFYSTAALMIFSAKTEPTPATKDRS